MIWGERVVRVGRADLLRVLKAHGAEALHLSATQLGLRLRVESPERRSSPADGAPSPEEPSRRAEERKASRYLRPVRVTYEPDASDEDVYEVYGDLERLTDAELAGVTRQRAPQAEVGEHWSRLVGPLGRALSTNTWGKDVEVPRLIDSLAREELWSEIPRVRRRAVIAPVWILLDRAKHLRPLFEDQEHVARSLLRLVGRGRTRVFTLIDGVHDAIYDAQWRKLDVGEILPGTQIMAITDLGVHADVREQHAWRRLGNVLRERSAHCHALVPPGGRDARGLGWSVVPWSREEVSDIEAAVARLLPSLAYAYFVERGHLRSLITAVEGRTRLGVELSFARHPHAAGERGQLWIEEDHLEEWRAAFRLLDAEQQRRIIEIQHTWRRHHPAEQLHVEILSLAADGFEAVLPPGTLTAAESFIRRLVPTVRSTEDRRTVVGFWQHVASWVPSTLYQRDDEVGEVLRALWLETQKGQTQSDAPAGMRLSRLLRRPRRPGGRYEVRQETGGLRFVEGSGSSAGSLVGTVIARADTVVVAEEGVPSWATRAGYDRFGRWAAFEVNGVEQVMRWIPAGTFRMGSPGDDPEAYDDEQPQHEVTLTEGYWLAETPCTQALWKAVAGDNPCEFRGSDRPVESVSFDDVSGYLYELNKKMPGLSLRLPTEAEWEYACRAGSEQPRCGELDAVAWYSSNSELGSQPVKKKLPNRWGLFDMLGNVDEWCADGGETGPDSVYSYGRRYTDEAVSDPFFAAEGRPGRVVRGWRVERLREERACGVRGALRRGARDSVLGFRMARGRALVSGGDRAGGPAEPAQDPRASGGTPESPAERGTHVKLGTDARVPVDLRSIVHVRSDVMTLELEPFTQPDWASGIGRDRCGLWADIRVGDVRHRLRWIPPGRFMMGSPGDEPGRYDDEGPRHPVTITEGLWLGETPCTQEFWEAVMSDNPSRFRSPQRPVDQVSFDDVEDFLAKVSENISGLNLRLPSEAEWEYACRAGTSAATYAGPIEILVCIMHRFWMRLPGTAATVAGTTILRRPKTRQVGKRSSTPMIRAQGVAR